MGNNVVHAPRNAHVGTHNVHGASPRPVVAHNVAMEVIGGSVAAAAAAAAAEEKIHSLKVEVKEKEEEITRLQNVLALEKEAVTQSRNTMLFVIVIAIVSLLLVINGTGNLSGLPGATIDKNIAHCSVPADTPMQQQIPASVLTHTASPIDEAILLTRSAFAFVYDEAEGKGKSSEQLWRLLSEETSNVSMTQVLSLLSHKLFPKLSLALLASSMGVMLSFLSSTFLLYVVWPSANKEGRFVLSLLIVSFFMIGGHFLYGAASIDSALVVPGGTMISIASFYLLLIVFCFLSATHEKVLATSLIQQINGTLIGSLGLSLQTEIELSLCGLMACTYLIYWVVPFAPLVVNLLIVGQALIMSVLVCRFKLTMTSTLFHCTYFSILTWWLGIYLQQQQELREQHLHHHHHHHSSSSYNHSFVHAPFVVLEWSSILVGVSLFIFNNGPHTWRFSVSNITFVMLLAVLSLLCSRVHVFFAGSGALYAGAAIVACYFALLSFWLSFFSPPWKDSRDNLVAPLVNLGLNVALSFVSILIR